MMRGMRTLSLWSFILLLLVVVQATTGQAPGDEDDSCLEDVVNEEDLMSSFNYRNLVPSRGGPWTVVNDDNRNDGLTFSSRTIVSKTDTLCNDSCIHNFYFSGHKQEQPVEGLLVCVDLLLVHKTTG